MIAVKIILEAFPEKQLEVMQTLVSLIKPVEKEHGCKSYYVSCDVSNKNCFYILEEWYTRRDLSRHIKSDIFAVLLGTKILLRHPLTIQIYTITQIQGFDTVTAERARRG